MKYVVEIHRAYDVEADNENGAFKAALNREKDSDAIKVVIQGRKEVVLPGQVAK